GDEERRGDDQGEDHDGPGENPPPPRGGGGGGLGGGVPDVDGAAGPHGQGRRPARQQQRVAPRPGAPHPAALAAPAAAGAGAPAAGAPGGGAAAGPDAPAGRRKLLARESGERAATDRMVARTVPEQQGDAARRRSPALPSGNHLPYHPVILPDRWTGDGLRDL